MCPPAHVYGQMPKIKLKPMFLINGLDILGGQTDIFSIM
jgi:hypothetical protein